MAGVTRASDGRRAAAASGRYPAFMLSPLLLLCGSALAAVLAPPGQPARLTVSFDRPAEVLQDALVVPQGTLLTIADPGGGSFDVRGVDPAGPFAARASGTWTLRLERPGGYRLVAGDDDEEDAEPLDVLVAPAEPF